MKKVLTAITLSIGAMLATSAMAAPQDYRHHPNDRYNQDHRYAANHQNFKYSNNNRWNDRDRGNDHRINPSREWRSGQFLPSQFNSSRYVVNYKNYRQLPRPDRNQQWLKVNGDYVLVNQRNHRIIRIIS